MTKNKRMTMTEELFGNIKGLMSVGITPKQIVQLGTGSPATIWRVQQATDYVDYKRIIEARHQKQLATEAITAGLVVAPEQENPAPVQPDTEMNGIVKDLFTIVQEQSEIIKRMDQSLTWLAEHAVIQSVTTKRRFF